MANKILITEREQYLHTDMVAFSGNVGFGFSTTLTGEISADQLPLTVNIEGVDAISLPAGNISERPAITDVPMFRYNTELKEFELYSPDYDRWDTLADDRELDELSAAVDRNALDITHLNNRLDAGEIAIVALSADLNTLSADVGHLEDRMDIGEGVIGANAAGVSDNSTRLDRLEYVDININSLTVNASVLEYATVGSQHSLTASWVINKIPTSGTLTTPAGSGGIPASTTGSYPYNYTVPDNSSGTETRWTFSLDVTDSVPPLSSEDTDTSNIYWVYPYYWGTSVNDIGGIDFGDLETNVSRKSTKNVPMNGTAVYIYFAYPATYGLLTDIRDGNALPVNNEFERIDTPLPMASGNNISYYIYKSKAPTTVNNGTTSSYKFTI